VTRARSRRTWFDWPPMPDTRRQPCASAYARSIHRELARVAESREFGLLPSRTDYLPTLWWPHEAGSRRVHRSRPRIGTNTRTTASVELHFGSTAHAWVITSDRMRA